MSNTTRAMSEPNGCVNVLNPYDAEVSVLACSTLTVMCPDAAMLALTVTVAEYSAPAPAETIFELGTA